MTGAENIKRNIEDLKERISAAAERNGRDCNEITMVVVSKFRTAEEIQAVIGAGINDIGENRVQEALTKRPKLNGSFVFRMIGHLQRNKAEDAVRIFDAIDSVDSFRLGQRLSEELGKAGKNMPVLIQVNSSAEETKHGFEPEEIEEAAVTIGGLPGIELRGLMTIGPLTDDEREMRRAFEKTRALFEKIRAGRPEFKELSMGMSDDFEMAIEEGSTMVRIGRAIFEGR
ncbi:MAG: YggS family pyridoxal phosphate-dependent enzyme [bacterium]